MDTLSTEIENVRHDHSALTLQPIRSETADSNLNQRYERIATLAKDISRNLVALRTQDQASFAPNVYSIVRETQFNQLKMRFSNLMTSYNEEQLRYRDSIKSRLVRQGEILNRSLSETEVEQLLDDGKIDQLFIDDFELTTEEVDAIKNQHQEIIRLEKSIRELNELFLDMSLIVDQQGEILDTIEANVQRSRGAIDQSGQTLQQAQVLKRKVDKKRCLCIVFLVILIAIIVILLAVFIPRLKYFPVLSNSTSSV